MDMFLGFPGWGGGAYGLIISMYFVVESSMIRDVPSRLGRDHRQWGEDFFFEKKIRGEYFFPKELGGEDFFFRINKGGEEFFSTKKRGPRYPVNFDRSLRKVSLSHSPKI